MEVKESLNLNLSPEEALKIAEDWAKIFSSPEWESMAKFEELLYQYHGRALASMRVTGDHVQFAISHASLAGQRDGLMKLWKEREKLLNLLKEDENEHGTKEG